LSKVHTQFALIVANTNLDLEASMDDKARLSTVIDAAGRMLKDPAGFYRDMEKTGGFLDPLIYVVVMAAGTGLIIAVLSLLGAGMTGAIAIGLGAVVVFPVFAVIGSFIAAAILFLTWKLLGSNESYQTGYRCVAYATVVYPVSALLGLIPYLGSMAGVVWGMYLMTVATTEVHRLKRKTAYIVFGVLGVLLIISNISAERESRRMAPVQKAINEQSPENEYKPPVEAGEAMDGFLKGFEKATGNSR
jgi:hypothetical protein